MNLTNLYTRRALERLESRGRRYTIDDFANGGVAAFDILCELRDHETYLQLQAIVSEAVCRLRSDEVFKVVDDALLAADNGKPLAKLVEESVGIELFDILSDRDAEHTAAITDAAVDAAREGI